MSFERVEWGLLTTQNLRERFPFVKKDHLSSINFRIFKTHIIADETPPVVDQRP